MRIALVLVIQFALQGCVAYIAAGPAPDGPSFLILRDDRLLTSLTVACEPAGPDGSWQTQWKISGETTWTAIDYGVAPEGMTTIVSAAPIKPSGQICSVETHSKSKSGKTFVDKSLWILDPFVRSCGSMRSCKSIINESVTARGLPRNQTVLARAQAVAKRVGYTALPSGGWNRIVLRRGSALRYLF